MKHFCEISLKSVYWSRRRCHLKVFSILALAAISFSGEKTIFAILVEGHPRNVFVKLF